MLPSTGSNFSWSTFSPESREVYNTTILMKEAAQNIGIEVNPPRVLTDFELALQQCVTICFPQAERKGCLFHYAQTIWIKLQGLGLQVLYREDDEFRCFVNSVIALAFVPLTFLRVAWRGLKREAPVFANREEFFEFPGNIDRINVPCLHVECPLLGWHSKLSKLVGKAHPNIYEAVSEQAANEVTLMQLAAEDCQ